MRIEDAIKQEFFAKQTSKVAVNLLYTASWFSTELARSLKHSGLSWQQFNIMRILRGQRGNRVTLKDVTERMIDPMSNTSRLVDKLVTKGFVERHTNIEDRREILLTLTEEGRRHLSEASKTVEDLADNLFGHLPPAEMNELNSLLDKSRNGSLSTKCKFKNS